MPMKVSTPIRLALLASALAAVPAPAMAQHRAAAKPAAPHRPGGATPPSAAQSRQAQQQQAAMQKEMQRQEAESARQLQAEMMHQQANQQAWAARQQARRQGQAAQRQNMPRSNPDAGSGQSGASGSSGSASPAKSGKAGAGAATGQSTPSTLPLPSTGQSTPSQLPSAGQATPSPLHTGSNVKATSATATATKPGTAPVHHPHQQAPTLYDRAVMSHLHHARNRLATADHDYNGHRVQAMHHVVQAIHHLGGSGGDLTGYQGLDGSGNLPQAQSDAILRESMGRLQTAHNQLSGKSASGDHHARSRADVAAAIQQLRVALSVN